MMLNGMERVTMQIEAWVTEGDQREKEVKQNFWGGVYAVWSY